MPDKSEVRGQRSEVSKEEAITVLLAAHAKGFTVNAAGELTANEEATRIETLEQLSGLTRASKVLQFSLPGGQRIELTIRPLDGIETGEIEDLEAEAPMPPKKQRAEGRGQRAEGRGQRAEGGSVIDEYDFEDKEYRRALKAHNRLKRAAIIVHGLEMDVPGANLEAQADYLAKAFPRRMTEAIETEILALSIDPIERAVFI